MSTTITKTIPADFDSQQPLRFSNVRPSSLPYLWAQAKAGDPVACKMLFDHYTPLALKIAARLSQYKAAGMESEDLLGMAVIALPGVIAAYDPAKGRFEAFARLAIKRSVISAIRASNFYRGSADQVKGKIEAAAARVEARTLRAATNAEIAAELDITIDELEKKRKLGLYRHVGELDVQWFDAEGYTMSLVDVIPDPRQDVEAAVSRNDKAERVHAAINDLPDLQRRIVRERALNDVNPSAVAENLCMSQSSMWMHYTRGIKNLRIALSQDAEAFISISHGTNA